MGLTLRIESPIGNPVSSMQFEPGQRIRITGKSTGLLGFGEPGFQVRLQVFSPYGKFAPIQDDVWTNIWGNYWFDITLPSVITEATVQVQSGSDRATATIGIGLIPKPTPGPSSPIGDIAGLVKLGVIAVIGAAAVSALAPMLSRRGR